MSDYHVMFTAAEEDVATILLYEDDEFQELYHGSPDELSEWMRESLSDRCGPRFEGSEFATAADDRQRRSNDG